MLRGNKHYSEASVFLPENLLREARRQKRLEEGTVPEVCVLDPDGDLVEYLIRNKLAIQHKYWAGYHTKMYETTYKDVRFGIIGCGVGAPFAVLMAEQLFVSGCTLLVSITSSGIINAPEDGGRYIWIEEALRDEGTSDHYLPHEEKAAVSPLLKATLKQYFSDTNFPIRAGNSWTTDAPYRETTSAIQFAKEHGITCVEMEAAALYTFAKVKNKKVICFARLTNTMAQTKGDFEKGEEMGSLEDLELIHHTIKAIKGSTEHHWNKIYLEKTPQQVSWTEPVPQTSLEFIRSFHLPKTARIIDVGGGDSRLVDFLLREGFEHITVLDISGEALERVKARLGKQAEKVTWVVSDINDFKPSEQYDVWHDRAAFHFQTDPQKVADYVRKVAEWVRRGLVMATFSTKGPEKCSGLDVQQYDEAHMTALFGASFERIDCRMVDHITPFNTIQNFIFCSFEKR